MAADAAAAEPGAAADAEADGPTSESAAADDFEFCILSSGGIVPAGSKGAAEADMCVADEVFSQGKLLPLRRSSAAAAAADGLPMSESAASTVGLVSRSGSGSASASSSGSSSGCVSRSQSSKSASSDPSAAAAAAALPPRRSLSSSVFYAHPSPSPRLRSSSARPRRSTGGGSSTHPSASWALFRLGVVGTPDVYPPPPGTGTGRGSGGGSRSARFEQVATATAAVDKKLVGFGAVFGDGLGCRCSPDVVEPVRRKKDGGAKSGHGVVGLGRRSRIVEWLEELSVGKERK